MPHERERRTTYAKIVELLGDGEWHREPELASVSSFPEHWVTELEREGYEVARADDGSRLVRLAQAVC